MYIELPNLDTPLNINIENNIQISRPSIFEGELLKYIPDNFVKMFNMHHLKCKEYQQYIGYTHFLEHAKIEKEPIQ